ncbi:MAG: Gfo/Idh/MocA family oxidoreductase [Syntrophales bacterium]
MTQNRILKVGIAGYGIVGKRRRQFIDLNPDLVTVAVSDISFGQPGMAQDGVKFYPTYHGLFNEKLDVLFVSVPNYLAAEATIAGLERGLHVFCEKPPGRTIQDIRDVVTAEKKQPHLKLKYGFNHRYHESVKEAKKVIESGQYGEIVNLRGIYGKSNIIPFDKGWRSERQYAGGGILLDQGIHLLDMICYFAGDFEEVKSFVSNSYWHHDVEDNAYAIMRNRSGCVAMLHSTATQWQHKFRLEITLRDALVELSGILSGTKSYGDERLKIIPKKDSSSVGSFLETTNSYLDDNSWQCEIDEFADIIIKDKMVLNGNSSDALKVMGLIYKIYCADERWQKEFNIQRP